MLPCQFHAEVFGASLGYYTQKKFANHCHSLYRKDLLAHFGCVNAINFSRSGNLLVSGGDDRRVILWNTNEVVHNEIVKPVVMKSTHHSNIFATMFDCSTEHILSSGNDEKVIRHDIESMTEVGTFLFDEAIYSIDVSPYDCHLFVTAGEDGTVQLCDIRNSHEYTRLALSGGAFHCVSFNPIDSVLVATANSVDGISLWDVRIPEKKLLTYGSLNTNKSAMSVCFDYTGRKLLAMLRCDTPVIFDITNKSPLQEFASYGFSNKCTMKSACFAGDKDQFVVAGSEDFKVYLWDRNRYLETHDAHLTLDGHRSIVNQVRFNRQFCLIASSGVEKSIKIWSPYEMCGCVGDTTGEGSFIQRKCYTRHDRERLSRHHLSHDYSAESLEEDTNMLAFFDALIEKSREDSSDSSDGDSDHPDRALSAVLNLLDLPPLSTEISPSNEVSDEASSDGTNLGSAPHLERSNLQANIFELRRIFRGVSQPVEPTTSFKSNIGELNTSVIENTSGSLEYTKVNKTSIITSSTNITSSNKTLFSGSSNVLNSEHINRVSNQSCAELPTICSSKHYEVSKIVAPVFNFASATSSVDTLNLSSERTFSNSVVPIACPEIKNTLATAPLIDGLSQLSEQSVQTSSMTQFKRSEKRKKRKYRATNDKER